MKKSIALLLAALLCLALAAPALAAVTLPAGADENEPVALAATLPRRLNLREGPGLGHGVLARLPRGSELELLGYEGVWAAVLTESGLLGYVHSGYITLTQLIEPKPTASPVPEQEPVASAVLSQPKNGLPPPGSVLTAEEYLRVIKAGFESDTITLRKAKDAWRRAIAIPGGFDENSQEAQDFRVSYFVVAQNAVNLLRQYDLDFLNSDAEALLRTEALVMAYLDGLFPGMGVIGAP